MAERMRHLAGAALCAVVLALLATGCTPDPAPTPSPTGFASDEEAFAAAEATYRAYVDALNDVDLNDSATFESVYALTSGEANATARKEFSQMQADGWTVGGMTTPILIEVRPNSTMKDAGLSVCSDVSTVTLVDADGVSVIAADRPAVQSLLISLTAADAEWQITSISARSGDPTCE